MKALLITALVVLLLIFSYNKYSDYQRFTFDNYAYKTAEIPSEADPETTMLYHQKITQLNGHVITQWSVHKIDVRNPEDDDVQTLAARATYDQLLGEVSYLEEKLRNPKKEPLIDQAMLDKKKRHDRIKELFTSTSNNTLSIGSRGALVYELQKLLNANGSDIPEDGNFQNVTFESLKTFEYTEGLFPDGKLDMLTLEHLLEN